MKTMQEKLLKYWVLVAGIALFMDPLAAMGAKSNPNPNQTVDQNLIARTGMRLERMKEKLNEDWLKIENPYTSSFPLFNKLPSSRPNTLLKELHRQLDEVKNLIGDACPNEFSKCHGELYTPAFNLLASFMGKIGVTRSYYKKFLENKLFPRPSEKDKQIFQALEKIHNELFFDEFIQYDNNPLVQEMNLSRFVKEMGEKIESVLKKDFKPTEETEKNIGNWEFKPTIQGIATIFESSLSKQGSRLKQNNLKLNGLSREYTLKNLSQEAIKKYITGFRAEIIESPDHDKDGYSVQLYGKIPTACAESLQIKTQEDNQKQSGFLIQQATMNDINLFEVCVRKFLEEQKAEGNLKGCTNSSEDCIDISKIQQRISKPSQLEELLKKRNKLYDEANQKTNELERLKNNSSIDFTKISEARTKLLGIEHELAESNQKFSELLKLEQQTIFKTQIKFNKSDKLTFGYYASDNKAAPKPSAPSNGTFVPKKQAESASQENEAIFTPFHVEENEEWNEEKSSDQETLMSPALRKEKNIKSFSLAQEELKKIIPGFGFKAETKKDEKSVQISGFIPKKCFGLVEFKTYDTSNDQIDRKSSCRQSIGFEIRAKFDPDNNENLFEKCIKKENEKAKCDSKQNSSKNCVNLSETAAVRTRLINKLSSIAPRSDSNSPKEKFDPTVLTQNIKNTDLRLKFGLLTNNGEEKSCESLHDKDGNPILSPGQEQEKEKKDEEAENEERANRYEKVLANCTNCHTRAGFTELESTLAKYKALADSNHKLRAKLDLDSKIEGHTKTLTEKQLDLLKLETEKTLAGGKYLSLTREIIKWQDKPEVEDKDKAAEVIIALAQRLIQEGALWDDIKKILEEARSSLQDSKGRQSIATMLKFLPEIKALGEINFRVRNKTASSEDLKQAYDLIAPGSKLFEEACNPSNGLMRECETLKAQQKGLLPLLPHNGSQTQFHPLVQQMAGPAIQQALSSVQQHQTPMGFNNMGMNMNMYPMMMNNNMMRPIYHY